MDASSAHDFSTRDFASFLPPADPEQYLQFPPNSPPSHAFSFTETPLAAFPLYGFDTPAPTMPTSHPAMDMSGSTPSPRAPFVPTSPVTPPLTGSEVSGDSMSQGHGWTTTSATRGGRSGYNSGYNSASGYVFGGAGSCSDAGLPHSTNSYSSSLVYQLNRGICARDTAECSAHKPCASMSIHLVDEDLYRSEGKSELVLIMPIDIVVSQCREESRCQRIEYEQHCHDDLH
ncbi:hypothetical protein FRC12_008469 [Ceratobasidium sp. 428]|nr:hypothetical protein FRC12_008469 [Ceratobasidium sp. 428]